MNNKEYYKKYNKEYNKEYYKEYYKKYNKEYNKEYHRSNMYITQYEIYDIFQEERFIFMNFIKRNFKPKFRDDYIYKNKFGYSKLKKNINYYDLYEIIQNIYYRILKHKTGDTNISKLFYKFISYIKDNYDINDNKIKTIVYEFPKPKYLRKKWKRYFLLKNEIKKIKNIKRKVKKKYYGMVLEEKLNNINNELFDKQRRLKELADMLK